jgi:ABC-type hemin transport system ATPase subunit
MLKGIANEGKGVVLATHDLDLVSDFADRVVVLSQGRVTYEGPSTADLRSFLVLQNGST